MDQVDPKDAEKGGRRKNLMQKMFALAALEEQYKEQEIGKSDYSLFVSSVGLTEDILDGSTMVQPLEGELQKTIVRTSGVKRSRHSSLVARTADDEKSDSEERIPHKAMKKARTSQPKPKVVPLKQRAKAVAAGKPKRKTKRDAGAVSDAARQDGASDKSDRKPYVRGYEPLYNPQWDAKMQTGFTSRDGPPITPYNTSFGSTMSDVSSCDAATMIPPSPGASSMMQNNGAVVYQTDMQINNAYDVPHPQFDTMPNTPTFAPHEMLPFEQQHPNLGHEMAGLSIGIATLPQHLPSQGQQSPAYEHHMHGLPAQPTMNQYRSWPEMHPSPYTYQIHPDIPSSQPHHAGFAVGNDAPNPTSWTAAYQPDRQPHGDNDLPYNSLVFGPTDHEQPPATLPASVERGFTGHSSGVGDSAYPPGYPMYS